MESISSAFAVPPRLFSRKRKASAAAAADSAEDGAARAFFTEAGYARFSAYGEVVESRIYADEELRRATCLTTTSSSKLYTSSAVTEKKTDDSAGPSTVVAASGTTAAQTQSRHPLQSPALATAMASTALAIAQRPAPPSRKHLLQILAEKKGGGGMHVRIDILSRRLSSLTIPQHEQYMQLLQKRIHSQRSGLPAILALSTDENAQWQALDALVRDEQLALWRDIESIVLHELAPAMALVPAAVESWYEKMLIQCRNDAYQMYPRYFEPSMSIVAPQTQVAAGELCVMKHVKEVFSHGSCPAVHEERFVDGMQILAADTDMGGNGDAFLVRHAISADTHAEKLMEKFDCDVALSSSTLVTLFDTEIDISLDKKPREWVIPVKSRVFVGKSGVAKRHVYFDKPLPAEAVSAREKIADAARASLLTALQSNASGVKEEQQQPQHGNSARGRTVYHIWELGGRRILVRCTTHAHLVTKMTPAEEAQQKPSKPATRVNRNGRDTIGAAASAGDNNIPQLEKSQPLSVFIKPDYRFLGIDEQITRSEKRRFWLHSWLRGGSALVIGRLDPQSLAVSSWERHSLASLVYGHDPTHAPEWFEPREGFQIVNDVFAAACSVPAGNYAVQSRPNGRVDLLMATTASTPSTEGSEAMSNLLDLFHFASSARDSSEVLDVVLPKWTYQQGRIPYSFRTGSYCVPFYVNGICPQIAENERCYASMHIRRVQASTKKSSSSSKSAPLWSFDDFSKHLKKTMAAVARGEDIDKKPRPTYGNWLRPDFPFCRAAHPVDAENLHSSVRCPKPVGECSEPHLTVHEVAERVADSHMHRHRDMVRRSKSKHRHRFPQ